MITLCAEPISYIVETAGGSMLRSNRCQLREAKTLMTAAPVSSPNDASSDDNIAASEPTGGNAEPGARTKSGRVVKIPTRYLE